MRVTAGKTRDWACLAMVVLEYRTPYEGKTKLSGTEFLQVKPSQDAKHTEPADPHRILFACEDHTSSILRVDVVTEVEATLAAIVVIPSSFLSIRRLSAYSLSTPRVV